MKVVDIFFEGRRYVFCKLSVDMFFEKPLSIYVLYRVEIVFEGCPIVFCVLVVILFVGCRFNFCPSTNLIDMIRSGILYCPNGARMSRN